VDSSPDTIGESSSNPYIVRECFSEDEDDASIATFENQIEDTVFDGLGLDDDDDQTSNPQFMNEMEDTMFELQTGFAAEGRSMMCSRNCKDKCANIT
jgi:hypothetical protein